MKKLMLFAMLMWLMLFANAAYLKNVPMTVTQPDGTKLECFASGDEFYNYLHDAQGFTIIQNHSNGYYVYADLKDGELVPTDLIAGRSNPASRLKPYLNISPEKRMDMHKAWEIPEDQQIKSVNNREKNHGILNNIVIFIRFADDTEFTNSFASINNMFNTNSSSMSMQSYFDEASYHQINIPTTFYPAPDGDNVISYQDIYNRNYFQPYDATTNPDGYLDDERTTREHSLLKRAVDYVNENNMIPSDLNVDYDNDGKVDNVCFVVRGTCGAWSSLLWPHQWTLYSETVYINSKRVWTFNFQLADSGEDNFGTSTMCHEMNHSLGAPDLYHYYYGTDINPAGAWDLMEINENPPQHMGIYMKYKYGNWIDEIPEITESGVYTLHDISSSTNNCYKMASSVDGQYYVFEYRNKDVEPAVPGSGLLIYRINTAFNGNANYNGTTVFDEIYIYRLNGTTTTNGDYNKAYFSSGSGRTNFDATTNPQPFLTDGTIDNNIMISDVTAAGSTISFRIGCNCDAPTNLTAFLNDNTVTLSWDAVEGVESYSVFRDGVSIDDAVSATTFCDELEAYGTFEYCVKSNCTGGGYSMASTVIVNYVHPGPFVTDLSGDVDENQVTLTWTAPASETAVLKYTDDDLYSACGYHDGTTYWGQRYTPEQLAPYAGMAIQSFEVCTNTVHEYTFHIYKEIDGKRIEVASKVFNSTVQCGWNTITMETPVYIDYTHNLIVAVHGENVYNPAVWARYFGDDPNVGLMGTDPYFSAFLGDRVWLMRTNITDGTYTYNIYKDNVELVENQTGSSYSYTENDKGFHEYYLKTNYFGGESQPSNSVNVPAGSDNQFVENLSQNWSDESNWSGGKPTSTDNVWIKNDVVIDEDVTIKGLYINDNTTVTVSSGKTLTISEDAENLAGNDGLVIESNAAFVNNSENVNGTVKRQLTAVGSKDTWDGKWHLLASPVAAANISDFTNNTAIGDYDLYIYDEPNNYWYNEKADNQSVTNAFYTNNGTTFKPGCGYLTSFSNDATMSFAGTINAGEISIPVTASASTLKGFNLIGNPYPCSIDWNATSGWTREVLGDSPYIWIYNDNLDQYGAYQLGAESGTNGVSNIIASCQGFFVKATENGNIVINDDVKTATAGTFRKGIDSESISIKVTGKNGSDEVMIIRNSETHNNAEKLFSRNENAPSLYLKVDGENYSIVNVDDNDSFTIPMEFRCGTTGKFTISSNANVELVDNQTGIVTDLSTNSYEFYGSNADSYNRFVIRTASDTDEIFVYQNGNELIINGNEFVQIIDCLGRIVFSDNANNCRIDVTNLNTGVYIVRMNGNTQKIFIR